MATFNIESLSSSQTPFEWRQHLNSFVQSVNSIDYVVCKKDCTADKFQQFADSGVRLGCEVNQIWRTTTKAGITIYSLGSTSIKRKQDFYALYINGKLQSLSDWKFCDSDGNDGTTHISIHRISGITVAGLSIILKEFVSSESEDSKMKYDLIKNNDGILTDAEAFQDYYAEEEEDFIALNVALTKTRKGYI